MTTLISCTSAGSWSARVVSRRHNRGAARWRRAVPLERPSVAPPRTAGIQFVMDRTEGGICSPVPLDRLRARPPALPEFYEMFCRLGGVVIPAGAQAGQQRRSEDAAFPVGEYRHRAIVDVGPDLVPQVAARAAAGAPQRRVVASRDEFERTPVIEADPF